MFSKSEPTFIPYKRVYVDPADNVRQGELPFVAELAARIAAGGQLTPIVVTKEDDLPKGYEYRLRAGARRHKAFELLGWEGRQIMAVVRSYKGEDAAARAYADTWSENFDRVNVSAIDQADAIGRLVSGTYGSGGKAERPLTKEEIATVLGLTEDVVRLGIRISTRLTPLAKELVRAQEPGLRAPARRLAAWALKKSEEDQLACVHAWIAERKAASDAGRQRAPRKNGDAAHTADDGDEEPRTRGTIAEGKRVGKKGIPLSEHLQAALHAAGLEKDKEEKRYLEGLADGLRFVTGDYVGQGLLPGLRKDHYEAVAEEAAE